LIKELGQAGASSWLLKNGRVIDPAQNRDEQADILILDGKIVAIGTGLTDIQAQVVDCKGLWVVPGLIDVHCHLRDPGFEHKETMESGTKAAARGGFTTIVAMANVNPVPDNLNTYNKIQKLIEKKAVIRVIQAASVTKDLKGRDLSDMASLVAAGVKIFTDDGQYIERASVLYQALHLANKLGAVIMLHEEDTSLKLYWPTAYEPVNETAAIARDLEILRATGGKLHFQHLSTAKSVELIRTAKKAGLCVTAEVCPHHLTLSTDEISLCGTNAKMAPPLRTIEDQEALIQGLNDGTIDFIATDHAPHALDDKNVPFDLAANGIVGLETALPVLLTKLVHGRGLSPVWLIKRMSYLPAKIFGLSGGTLTVGSEADICVIDPDVKWKIDSSRFLSKGRNTPYQGVEVQGDVRFTFVNGKQIYHGFER
jgi:dihydroorotase